MKPSLLQAYEKGRRIIETMDNSSISAARTYITLFSKMFVYGKNIGMKDYENAVFYRKDLLNRFNQKITPKK